MIFSLFDKTPVLDADSSQWLFDTYAWAMKQFNAEIFYNQTPLVLPTNDYLPGRVDSVHGMASLIFERVKGYAGVSHWPTLLADQSSCALVGPPKVEIKGALRGPEGIADDTADEAHRLLIPYNPQQINNPEGMIATFAHIIAHYLAQMANEPPPGGAEYWPHATELLAVYLGFGVMFANSAFTFRGGCGSCYNPNANRDAYLTEIESTYALAIFGVLKEIPNSEVTRHLKKHLRGTYKKAVGDIQGRTEDLAMLTALR